MKMEIQLSKTILFFISFLLISCKGDAQKIDPKKEKNIEIINNINFFDKKFEKSVYSVIIDESNISDHPMESKIK